MKYSWKNYMAQRLFLYLAGRNKQGIKLIAILQGESMILSRVTDLKRLNLPFVWMRQILKIIDDNKMLYEPWIESANSYIELKERLTIRGYKQLPMGATPMLELGANPPKANTSSCKVQKTMIRKKWK